ncbi:MAG TPA: ABC transporter substrate-binding protein [Methylomirabilota bacterium]|nr:ABC transporter substrate-binding protein [Methylomirabilota bacterium]
MLGIPALVLSLVAAALGWAPAADAQQEAPARRVGVLWGGSPGGSAAATPDALVKELAALGWVEGKNLTVERRYNVRGQHQLAPAAAELARKPVDLILAVGSDAAQAARQAAGPVPVVFAAVHAPVETGLVRSLDRPGGNMTGSAFDLPPARHSEMAALLREAAPHVFRQGILLNIGAGGIRQQLESMVWAHEDTKVNWVGFQVDSEFELTEAFKNMRREQVRAMVVMPGAVSPSLMPRVLEFMARNRIPAVYPTREFVEVGGLMAYGPNASDAYRHAATLADRVLRGARPAELAVARPVRFQPVVNLTTARSMGFSVPKSILDRAEKIGE